MGSKGVGVKVLILAALQMTTSALLMYAAFFPLSSVPLTISQLAMVSGELTYNKDRNPFLAAVAFCCLYVTIQTYGIPGSLLLSILSGHLFGPTIGLALVLFSATTGASGCFLLSKYVLGPYLLKSVPAAQKLMTNLNAAVKNQENPVALFCYLLFLRATPLVPNIALNIASPLAGISVRMFAASTFVGLIPASYLHVKAGKTLGDMTIEKNDSSRMSTMIVLGCLALTPVLLKPVFSQMEKKFIKPKSSPQADKKVLKPKPSPSSKGSRTPKTD